MNNGQNGFYYHASAALPAHALADAAILLAVLIVAAITLIMEVRRRHSRQTG